MSEPPPDRPTAPQAPSQTPSPTMPGADPPAPRPGPGEPDTAAGPWGPRGAFGGVALAIAAVVFASIPVFVIAGDSGLDATIGSQLVLEASFLGAALFFALRRAPDLRAAFAALGVRRPRVAWGGITAITFFAYIVFAIVFSQLVADPEQVDVADQLGFDQSTLGAISAAILIVVLAPLAEEVFFRGLFFGGLRAQLPFAAAALIAGAFFGAIHLVSGNWAVAVQLGVLGFALCFLYERTGSLWAPITVHTINNALAFMVLVTT